MAFFTRPLDSTTQREKLAATRLEEDKATARDVRGKFVAELWGLAREFRIREQEQAKADQLSKKLTRLEGVETELRDAERYNTYESSLLLFPEERTAGLRSSSSSVCRTAVCGPVRAHAACDGTPTYGWLGGGGA